MKNIRIHIASPAWALDEYAKIASFFEKYRDPGNSIRDPEVLMKAIEDHKAYLMTDINSGELLGVSFCFANGDGDYTESGGTRIIDKINGYGLQTIISYVKTMHEFVMDPPIYEYYCVIKELNEKSAKNMQAACFEKWRPDQRLLDLRQHHPIDGRVFYVLTKTKLPIVRDRLIELVNKPTIKSKYKSEYLNINFDMEIIRSGILSRDLSFEHLSPHR